MPKQKPIYKRGVLADTVIKAIATSPAENWNPDKIIDDVMEILPKAKSTSIRSYITYELVRRGWVAKTGYGGYYTATSEFGKKFHKAGRKEAEIPAEDKEITPLDIGKGVVDYVNKLKNELYAAEQDVIKLAKAIQKYKGLEEEIIELTRQRDHLQDLYNKVKMNGGLTEKEIFF